MSTTNPQHILEDIELLSGRGCLQQNLANVLNALWQVADARGRIERALLEPHLERLTDHIKTLAKNECLMETTGEGRGRPLVRLTLLKRALPKKPTPVPKMMSPGFVYTPVVVKPKEVLPTRCQVFVDALNLCRIVDTHENGVVGKIMPIRFDRTHWEMFRELAVKISSVPEDQLECRLYTKVLDGGSDRFQKQCQRLEQMGIRVFSRPKKDVDCMINVDMVTEPLPHLREGEKFKIILVSGDSDFSYAVEKIRALAKKVGALIEVYVLTWRKSLASELAEAADHVYPIEPHLNELDPAGAAQLRLYYEKKAA